MESLEAFLSSRAARRLSPRTLAGYRQHISSLIEACGGVPGEAEPIEAFLADLNVSRNTQRNYHRTLAAFYAFRTRRSRLPNPMELIEAPRKERTVKPIPTPDQVRRMFAAAKTVRDVIMLTLVFDTGCRVGELIHMTVGDIHGDLLRIPREGKTGERWVPVPPELPRLLRQAGITRGPLVASLKTGNPLSVVGAERAYQRVALAAGLPENLRSPHSARRYAATQVNRKRGITAAMILLGHRDPRTTMAYIDSSAEGLLPTWKADRPLAGVTSIADAHAARASRMVVRFRFELFDGMSVRQLARMIGVSFQQVHAARAGYWGIGRKFIDGALRAWPDKGFWEMFEEVEQLPPLPLRKAA